MPSIGSITGNAIEDGVEDFVSTLIFQRMREISEPLKKQYENDSPFDEAMQSFIQTMSMGLTMYGIQKVMSFFFERGVKYLSTMYAFIVGAKLKKIARDKLKNSGFRGKKAFQMLGRVLDLDRTPERIEMVKIAQSNIDSYDRYKMHYENQSNSMQARLDTFSQSVSGVKAGNDLKTMTLFNDLTARGAWSGSSEHKRIYENATGKKLTELGVSWASLYPSLNKYTQFHKTANNEILNLTSAINKLVATKGS